MTGAARRVEPETSRIDLHSFGLFSRFGGSGSMRGVRMSLARVFSGFRLTPGRRLPPLVRSRHGADGSAAVAGAGWAGGLSFVALILSALKEARAADPDVTLFDQGTITYKDFEHGSFELVTKEAVPRHIVVDDPGQTVVLTKNGSSVSFAQVANSATRMEDLQAQQQDVLANYAKEHGPPGSSTPPGDAPELAPQPINFIEPDGPLPQHALPALVVPASSVPDTLLVHSPPTLTLGAGPIEVDTVKFDDFSATSGSFSATSFGSGAAPILGIAGGEIGPVVIAGATYNVEKPGSYGILYLNSATGAYTYVPNNDAINALKAPTTDSFTITASDGLASASQTFTVDINGTDDASVISGHAAGSVVAAAAGAHGVPTASGTLTDTDVDDPANTFTAVSSPHAEQRRLRQLHNNDRRALDLHAQRRQRRGPGAEGLRHADRHIHRDDDRRHSPDRDHHDPGLRRSCRRLRRHAWLRGRGGRGPQCQARRPDRDRSIDRYRRRRSGQHVHGGEFAARERSRLRQLHHDR